jgi:hypothetical protein
MSSLFFLLLSFWPICVIIVSFSNEGLFISNVFEGIGEDYSESQKIPNSPFTTPGFDGIIPICPHKSPLILLFF